MLTRKKDDGLMSTLADAVSVADMVAGLYGAYAKLEATRALGLFRWQQYLKFSTVGSTKYFDEGNGAQLRR